jgi:hypothetical protein
MRWLYVGLSPICRRSSNGLSGVRVIHQGITPRDTSFVKRQYNSRARYMVVCVRCHRRSFFRQSKMRAPEEFAACRLPSFQVAAGDVVPLTGEYSIRLI